MGKRYRCFDSLGVRARDARPTLETIQQFFTNALRSSGSRTQALEKTKRMFDLKDMKVGPDDKIVSFRVADQGPPTEARYNLGNKAWVATLPPGYYEMEAGGDFVSFNRVSDEGGREFVIALPVGPDYSAEEDEAGIHVYAKAADEPERVPLSDTPAHVGDHGHMPGALKRMNERLMHHYGSQAQEVTK